jgi:iron complex outermembrane receptor protein
MNLSTHRQHSRCSETKRKISASLCFLAVICCGGVTSFGAADRMASVSKFKQMTLSELMDVEVTSVSKAPEPYHNAAAALAVITDEHIRRSGATTVPETLRWVPGIHVARQNSNTWAVSARGFSSVNSEKLLVLSDTRSIYTPLFSGVAWSVQDYLMADIERIEVIRGPGAALWGSNAVNGVINITTKSAAETHGSLIETSAGTEERIMAAVRYGAVTPGGVHYRVFGKYIDRDESFNTSPNSDDWQLGHFGFRADWKSNARDDLTLQADVYRGTIGQLAPTVTIINRPGPAGKLKSEVSGGNILGRWRRHLSESSNLQFRAYYDRTQNDDPSFRDELDTLDFDLQHRSTHLGRHEFIWGLNQRTTVNRNESIGIFRVKPVSSTDYLYSGFVQDQITAFEVLRITLGTKVEHNDFSGFELQPSVRAAWDINANNILWTAVSRAARIPTRLERDIFIDVSNPAGNPVARLLGNEDFDSEKLVSYELGYRWRASEVVHVGMALFENEYNGLSSLEFGPTFIDPADGRTVIPIVNRNLSNGRARGAETMITYTPSDWWRLSGSYSYLTLRMEPSGQDINRGEFYEDATPRHQYTLNSYLTLPGALELDFFFRRVSAIHRLPTIPNGTGIPAYSELDIHLSWLVSPTVRFSLVGQNLLHKHHLEFGTPASRGEIKRGTYAKFTWEL